MRGERGEREEQAERAGLELGRMKGESNLGRDSSKTMDCPILLFHARPSHSLLTVSLALKLCSQHFRHMRTR